MITVNDRCGFCYGIPPCDGVLKTYWYSIYNYDIWGDCGKTNSYHTNYTQITKCAFNQIKNIVSKQLILNKEFQSEINKIRENDKKYIKTK